jgi:hypothetical protein
MQLMQAAGPEVGRTGIEANEPDAAGETVPDDTVTEAVAEPLLLPDVDVGVGDDGPTSEVTA